MEHSWREGDKTLAIATIAPHIALNIGILPGAGGLRDRSLLPYHRETLGLASWFCVQAAHR
jgi:hypothetical protein